MKNLFTLFTLVAIGMLSAQPNQNVVNNTSQSLLREGSAISSSYGASTLFYNPKREVEGTVHLFDNWNNYAIIQTNDNQKFVLKNINLNLERNTFESKIGQDSLFSFNFNNIDKFIVNSMVFKNYYWNDDNRVYQIIYEDKGFSILKAYSLKLIEGSPNPMINRKTDRYIKKERYFLRKDDKISQFKLKKNRILKLMDGDQNKIMKILKYVKNNDLSFKSENDIKKILDFFNDEN